MGPFDAILLDGYIVPTAIYDGSVSWHEQLIDVAVLQTDRDSIIGMGLLENSTLTIQIWDGGEVLIEERA